MSLEGDIARKFLCREPTAEQPRPGLRPVVRVSTLGIALGLLLILISFFIIDGFKEEIRRKIDGLTGNVKISNPDNTFNRYTLPLDTSEELLSELERVTKETDPEGSLHTFIDLMALIKADSAFRAAALHGVDSLFDSRFIAPYLVEGAVPDFRGEGESEVLMSAALARLFGLRVGDSCLAYFSDGERTKVRKLVVSGLFETGFEEYDRSLVLADVRLLRGVAGFGERQAGGIQLHLSDHSRTRELYDRAFDLLAERNHRYDERYTMFTSEELYPGIFGWLGLLDANVYMILVLMIIVAGITMTTGIVVLVLEKVRAIALLKTLGESDRSLRRVFLLVAAHVLGRGVLLGNLLALLLGAVQLLWRPLKLDPSQYYTAYVPISIHPETLLLTDLLVVAAVLLLVLIPARAISRVRPAQALRFE